MGVEHVGWQLRSPGLEGVYLTTSSTLAAELLLHWAAVRGIAALHPVTVIVADQPSEETLERWGRAMGMVARV